ncbi:hypothetical protein [Actinomadura sediminis]|uniref:MerR family transcriptional regulator n=1 Tax=Actinomadura sediminis TaxID=1038904 RepID=A0ABW3ES62_9ACTN
MPSGSIVALLACVVDGEATPELPERLSAERDRIEGRIGGLVDARDRLDAVIAAADNLRTGRHCDTR